MIDVLIAGIAGSPWTRAILRYGAAALAILLFLLVRVMGLLNGLEPFGQPLDLGDPLPDS